MFGVVQREGAGTEKGARGGLLGAGSGYVNFTAKENTAN